LGTNYITHPCYHQSIQTKDMKFKVQEAILITSSQMSNLWQTNKPYYKINVANVVDWFSCKSIVRATLYRLTPLLCRSKHPSEEAQRLDTTFGSQWQPSSQLVPPFRKAEFHPDTKNNKLHLQKPIHVSSNYTNVK